MPSLLLGLLAGVYLANEKARLQIDNIVKDTVRQGVELMNPRKSKEDDEV